MNLRPFVAGLALCLACASPATRAAEPDATQTAALHALFNRHWEELAQRYPEFATYRGDYRYNDRLADVSAEAIAEADARAREYLAQARAFQPDKLGATDRVSLDMFIRAREREVAQQAYPGWRTMRVGSLGGPQADLAGLLRVVPVASRVQVEQLLKRLNDYPRRMDQEIALLRRGLDAGWVSSRDVLERAIQSLDAQLPPQLEDGPFYAPFKKLGSAIPAAERPALQAAGRSAIQAQVLPAMQKLRRFLLDEYLPKAPANGALSQYPEGRKVYEMVVRQQTTTNLGSAELHAIGQRELKRLHAEMEAVMRETKFNGDFAAFIKFLYSDPKFFHTSPEALLAGYRDIGKRIDAELPRLFAELPRVPYGVRAMPAYLGPDAAEYYDAPARDGTRAGYFNANATGWRTRPTWGMPTLAAHEAVPGHHLQIARGNELKDLPEFRRGGFGYTAFVEGWALYAETLGLEIGLYDDPYARFGHLQGQALRAARLVVDTGIHSLGWTRQQAIDFMVDQVGEDRGFVTSEVDRYTSTPGQALAYMTGELKIIELRERAKAKLGAKFDLRRFHNAVIDNGALPLDTLEKLIDEWVATQG